MENTDREDVYEAFLECLKALGHPQSVYSDHDGAFAYQKLQKYFKDEGITHIVTLTNAMAW